MGFYYALAKGTIILENLSIRIVCNWLSMFLGILLLRSDYSSCLDDFLRSCNLEANTVKFMLWFLNIYCGHFNQMLTEFVFSKTMTDHIGDMTERDYSKGRSKSVLSYSKSPTNQSQTLTGDRKPKKVKELKKATSKRSLKKGHKSIDNVERLIKSTKTKNASDPSSSKNSGHGY